MVSTARMHVAVFLSALAGGGAQRRMLTLAREFAERGHRVDVVVARSNGPFRAQVSPRVRLVALDAVWTRLVGLTRAKALWVLASTPAFAAYLRRDRPEVVLSTSNPANLAALWACSLARTGTPIVVSLNVHTGEATGPRRRVWGPVLRALVSRFYPRADGIIAISEGVARDLVERTGIAYERITTVHNPIAIDEIRAKACASVPHPWARPDATPLLLAVGKLKPQKDFPTLLRAFARVRAAGAARLVILGEGEERSRLVQLAQRLGVGSDVYMPGFVENPFAWMARASVFVLSSAWEGFSNALAEALACGCPVVSTDCPSGPAEILDGGTYGALVPVGNAEALAEAVLATLRTPIARDRLRARAAEFSVGKAADRYLEVLARAIETAGAQEVRTTWTGRHDTLRSSFTR